MTPITFWFDPISPYAYLAFERLPEALEGCSYAVSYRPVLFAGLLKHWGQLGPAEIAPKRDWTYREVLWLARSRGIELALPAAHPFNPLPLLRLAWACAHEGLTPSRFVCESVLRHVWRGGAAADDAGRLSALEQALAPQRDPRGEAAKAAVRDATDAAIGRGVFGVPMIEAEGRNFWGFGGLDMLAACLRGDAWFDGPAWNAAAATPVGVQRRA